MNLPDSAITFLGNFRGIFNSLVRDAAFDQIYSTMPMIHCYCFTRELETAAAEADIRQVSYAHRQREARG